MQIACPACKTKISVPDEKIKPEGTKVKCGKCAKIFTVKKKSAGEATQAKPAAPAAAPEASSEADSLFGDEPTAPVKNAPPAKAPAPPPPEASNMEDELGLGRSSAPASDDESFFGGDNFGGEMDNYKTQLRPMGGGRDASLFGNSEQLDGNAPAPKPAAKSEDLFGSGDDLFEGGEEPAPPPPKPAAKVAAKKPAAAMPPKESLDDLFGKGLDDDHHDDLVSSLRDAKPKKAPALDTDDLFGSQEDEPAAPPPKQAAPKAPPPPPKPAPAPASSKLDDLFGDDTPEPPPPPKPAAKPAAASKGPTAEELASTLKLEPALKEEDLPKPPPPKPAEVKAAPAKKRQIPVKAIGLGVAGLAVAGLIAAAVMVPELNAPVKALLSQVGGLLEKKPEVKIVERVKVTASVTGGRLLTGGRGDSLYVVDGEVRNDYPGPRSFIKLKATIMGADGKAIDSREIFAGNTLNDEEIRGLDRVKIDGTLNRAPGGGLRNFNVPSGATIPFQVVFYDVEQPVQSQTVEPIGSEPGTE